MAGVDEMAARQGEHDECNSPIGNTLPGPSERGTVGDGLWNGGCRLVGKGHHHTSLTHYVLTHRLKVLSLFLFPSLPGPVVGEMPSAARYAAVGVVGRPVRHVVQNVLCEGMRALPSPGSTGTLDQLLL